jgi:hypothetical protein
LLHQSVVQIFFLGPCSQTNSFLISSVYNETWVLLFCSSNGTPHTSLLIMKGHFRSKSWINTAPVPTVLSVDIPTHMEPVFSREQRKFCVQRTVMQSFTKIHSFPTIAFFSHWNLCYLCGLEYDVLVIFHAAVLDLRFLSVLCRGLAR